MKLIIHFIQKRGKVMNNIDGQINLFEEKKSDVYTTNADKMEYLESTKVSISELFGFGKYTEIKIITFSSDINFISEMVKNFKNIEIIIGLSTTINKDINQIFAYQMAEQSSASDILKGNSTVVNMAKSGNLHAWVTRKIWSHQKLYLLKSEAGETRVIMGSANASLGAWNGSHIEDVQFCDSPSFYEKTLNDFNLLKINSTDNVSFKIKENSADNFMDEFPMSKEIMITKNAVILEPAKAPESIYEMIPMKKGKLLDKAMEQSNVKLIKNKDGNIAILPEHVEKISKAIDSFSIINGEKIKNPALTIDIENKTLNYGGKILI